MMEERAVEPELPAEVNERAPILLVDDRPSNLLSLKAILETPDYSLVLAGSGEEALHHVLREDYAVILLDVAMPGLDGFATATLIKQRERSKKVPIIFVTASVYDIDNIFRGYTVGAVDYLQKPLDPHAVRSKVAVFVELFRQRRRIDRQAEKLRQSERRERDLLRLRSEAAIARSRAEYETTFAEAPVGIGHAAPDGRWLRVNRRLSEILDVPMNELLDGRFLDHAHPDDALALAEAFGDVLAGRGTAHRSEGRFLRSTAGSQWLSISLSLLGGGYPEDRRVIVIVEDVTVRREIEMERGRLVQELRGALQSRDDFLSIAAHELKTPITPLRLQVASMLRSLGRGEPPPPERLQRSLQVAEESTVRLEALVDNLLDLSRIRVGRLCLDTEELDMVIVAREGVERMRTAAEAARCTLTVSAAGPVVGRWDRLRLEQAITNLLANAIKYGGGRPVEVEVSGDAMTASLSVRDHGIGIAPEARERIFERFERLVSVRHFGGFGLGLWIVRKIVEAHGGRIEVWSEPGEGSRFTIQLPRLSESRPAQPAKGTGAADAGREEMAPV